MDSIDAALSDAWNRLLPRVRADRVETLRRAMRRRSGTVLSRPNRNWCLSIRAADTRLDHWAWVPKYLPRMHEPHQITITSGTLRELCKPVSIPWPGIDWTRAAASLGRHPDSFRNWIKRAAVQVRYEHPASHGKHGHKVPVVWSSGPLNPNMDEGRAPDDVWGTLWQYMWNQVPDDLEFHVDRVPVWRPYPGHDSPRFRGWRFICPGLGAGGALPPSTDDALINDPDDPDPRRSVWATQHVPCGRLADRLFLPVKPWTIPDFLGDDDHLEVSFPFPSPSHRLTVSPSHRLSPPSLLPSVPPSLSLACHTCHRVHTRARLGSPGWNSFVADLSAGLLYGHEVKRPDSFAPERRYRFVHKRRKAPQRARVLNLLARGHKDRQIAVRLGMSYRAVRNHVRALYKRHGARNRADLCARAGVEYARPMPPRRAQVLRALLDGMSTRQIADRLAITRSGVNSHCQGLFRQYGVRSRAQLFARLRGRVFNRPAHAHDQRVRCGAAFQAASD